MKKGPVVRVSALQDFWDLGLELFKKDLEVVFVVVVDDLSVKGRGICTSKI